VKGWWLQVDFCVIVAAIMAIQVSAAYKCRLREICRVVVATSTTSEIVGKESDNVAFVPANT
jgi:hypothetical protein